MIMIIRSWKKNHFNHSFRKLQGSISNEASCQRISQTHMLSL